MLLRVKANNERGNVDNLFTNTNVPLPDQNTSMVDTLSKPTLKHLSLKSSLQEILNLQSQHIIETHTTLIEHTDTDQSADKSVTLEETLGVLVVELEKFTGGTTNFGKDKSDTPDFTLVAETVLAGKLELSIETSGLERSTGDLVSASSHDCI